MNTAMNTTLVSGNSSMEGRWRNASDPTYISFEMREAEGGRRGQMGIMEGGEPVTWAIYTN